MISESIHGSISALSASAPNVRRKADMDRTIPQRILDQFPYGLFIIGSRDGSIPMVIVADWAMQVSFDPLMLAVSIEEKSRMRVSIDECGFFSINTLPAGGKEIARALLKPVPPADNTFNGQKFTLGANGTPFLEDALAALECRVVVSYGTGDHRTFVGEVVDAREMRAGDVLTLKETGWHYSR